VPLRCSSAFIKKTSTTEFILKQVFFSFRNLWFLFFFKEKKGQTDAEVELVLFKFFSGYFCLFDDILYNKNRYLTMVGHPSCKHSATANLLKSYMLAGPCLPKTILFKNLNYPTLWQRAKFSHAKHLPAPSQEYWSEKQTLLSSFPV